MANTTVKVPQDSGTITITSAGATKRTFQVSGGTISVPQGQLRDVLRLVRGATVSDADAPATATATPAADQLPPASKDDLATPDPKRK